MNDLWSYGLGVVIGAICGFVWGRDRELQRVVDWLYGQAGHRLNPLTLVQRLQSFAHRRRKAGQ